MTSQPQWIGTIATASLGIYIVHPFFLVPIHLGLEQMEMPPLVTFMLAALFGIAGSIVVLAGWGR